MYDSHKVAARIRERIKQQGKTLRAVLTECSLGINTVSYIDSGRDITTQHFARIADCLECSMDYLMGRTDNPDINR